MITFIVFRVFANVSVYSGVPRTYEAVDTSRARQYGGYLDIATLIRGHGQQQPQKTIIHWRA